MGGYLGKVPSGGPTLPVQRAFTTSVVSDLVSWDELITPANLAPFREVPSELQGDLLLDATRGVLKNLNGALDGKLRPATQLVEI